MNHELLSTAGRQQLWSRIETEDPYLLAVTSVKARLSTAAAHRADDFLEGNKRAGARRL